jgi:hypothetical protein
MKDKSNTTHPLEVTFHEYLDGELPPQETTQFEAHLEGCRECTSRLAYWMKSFNQIESLPAVEPERNLAELVVSQLDTPAETRGVLNLILAEAAIGTTLGFVLWPWIQSWIDKTVHSLGSSWQSGIGQIQLIFSLIFEPFAALLDMKGLRIGSFPGESYWLLLVLAALVLLFLGNGIVLKTTQSNQ